MDFPFPSLDTATADPRPGWKKRVASIEQLRSRGVSPAVAAQMTAPIHNDVDDQLTKLFERAEWGDAADAAIADFDRRLLAAFQAARQNGPLRTVTTVGQLQDLQPVLQKYQFTGGELDALTRLIPDGIRIDEVSLFAIRTERATIPRSSLRGALTSISATRRDSWSFPTEASLRELERELQQQQNPPAPWRHNRNTDLPR